MKNYILNYSKWKLLEDNTQAAAELGSRASGGLMSKVAKESSDFKKYYISGKSEYVYRRAGKNSNGEINWQYQKKNTDNKNVWHTVTNKSSIEKLNDQYESNLKGSSGSAKLKKVNKYGISEGNSDYWTLITILACENYSVEDYPEAKQAMADTAQSIYNRYNTPGQPYEKTIKDIILSPNQYDPVTKGKKKGANWDNIKSKEDAIEVFKKTKGRTSEQSKTQIEDAISAQKDDVLINKAKEHVGSRTEFLSGKPKSSSAVGARERSPSEFNNTFFWNYAGKRAYHDTKKTAATSTPDSVLVAR